jgi:HAD superfamily hydrolase (TIGR01490 family)
MKTIIAFDFDGTLTKKDSFLEFIRFSKGSLFLYRNSFYFIFIWILFKIKIIKRNRSKEIIFSYCFKNTPQDKFNKSCNLFRQKLETIIRKGVSEKIEEYHNLNYSICIVSASIFNWIEPWAKENKIDTIIATEIEIKNNVLTGKFKTPNCVGIEKVNRLKKIFPNRDSYSLISFGDSSGDKELLNFSDQKNWNYFK